MKISELSNAPPWLTYASTYDADVAWCDDGKTLIWRGGVWRGGVWRGGVWRGGDWQGGVWRGGGWRGSVWQGGVWQGGVWQGGVWRGGVWRGGDWQGGVWQGGVWQGGDWRGGDWQGGDWQGGVWRGGYVRGAKVEWLHTLTHCEDYAKTLCNVGGIAHILAGCRWFTLAAAKLHWADRKDRRLTRAAMLMASEIARQKGWKEE